jgi:hypothetical protein
MRITTSRSIASLKHLLASGCILFVCACNSGKVEGTVYLAMQSGDVKRIAAHEVSLLEPGTNREAIRAVCAEFHKRHDPLDDSIKIAKVENDRDHGENRAAQDAASSRYGALLQHSIALLQVTPRKLDSIITHAVRKSVQTDIDGHFIFPNVPRGSYVLYATSAIGNHPYEWWMPIQVSAFATTHVELNNAAVDESLSCGII